MNNYSKQREIVLSVFKESFHPTAEEVYEKVHEKDPTISKSTVYRNLGVLLDNDVIRKVKVLDGPDRYDSIGKVHYHVICKNCGTVFDFMYRFENDKLESEIRNQTGVKTDVDSITLYGICEKCKSS